MNKENIILNLNQCTDKIKETLTLINPILEQNFKLDYKNEGRKNYYNALLICKGHCQVLEQSLASALTLLNKDGTKAN